MENNNFIRNTYLHVAGAIGVFTLIETIIIKSGLGLKIFSLISKTSYLWLIVIALFMGISWIAQKWAMSDTGRGMQYLGLSLYVVAEAFVFTPLIFIALTLAPDVLKPALLVTGFLVAGITFVAFYSKKDFSFLGKYLTVGGFIALGLIVAGILINGFTLGVWFAGAMAAFAGVSILHSTSNIIHRYNRDQYVAASLDLFASIALMFYYILEVFLLNRD